MEENNNVEVVSPFITVPAKIQVQIGKRKRFFDTVEEAQAALDKFNDPNKGRPGNKGIMAARKAAKELAAKVLALVQGSYPQEEGVSDQAYKIRCTTIVNLCTAKPAVFLALTGEELPVLETAETGEGDSQGSDEIVDPEATEGVNESSETVESAVDPLEAFM